jgi:hypothetical protein
MQAIDMQELPRARVARVLQRRRVPPYCLGAQPPALDYRGFPFLNEMSGLHGAGR